jgi:hypothetical protein
VEAAASQKHQRADQTAKKPTRDKHFQLAHPAAESLLVAWLADQSLEEFHTLSRARV